jgi:CMP-N-acetylneuraminic acid synthetase
MALDGYTVLAVVPARGGSKGIPQKNLRCVGGLSLVARAAAVARALRWLDAAIISTDDEQIAAEARLHGLDVPFMRPAELSGDAATSVDMWRHAWLESETYYSKRFDISVLLEPTSPLRRQQDVTDTIRALLAGDHKAAATISLAPAHFTPEKCLVVKNGLIEFFHTSGAQHSLRQSVPRYYFRNGLCYAVKRSTLVDENRILGADTVSVIVDRPVINIDDPIDLELAEYLLTREVR